MLPVFAVGDAGVVADSALGPVPELLELERGL